jgi:acetyl-CoA carboxylase carboxyl transferase subunit alpha
MARPEGYRKAIRLMDLADRFGLPVVTLVDTPGAYPGKAEERGQAEAIARSTEKCLAARRADGQRGDRRGRLGRGGGARRRQPRADARAFDLFGDLARGLRLDPVAQRREGGKEAAEALKMTAQDLLRLGVIDGIVREPLGGAHRDPRRRL